MQKAQSTAQPTWLETQMVARRQALGSASSSSPLCRAVTGFAAVAFGHPDGFDALPVGEGQQVADGAIGGSELLLNPGQADDKTIFLKLAAEIQRQRSKLIQVLPLLPV